MSTHLLARKTHRPRDGVCPLPDLPLARGRAHEICGAARRSFALWVAAVTTGPVLWIQPCWEPARLNPDGMQPFVDPARFLFLHAQRAEDLLWSCEEALRSGAVQLVVADLPGPPAMTPVRRLHLAAETGGSGGPAPLALLLTPGRGGAPGIESRWHLAPDHTVAARNRAATLPGQWLLSRLRARTAPPKSWRVTQPEPGAALELHPAPPEQPPRASAAASPAGAGTRALSQALSQER